MSRRIPITIVALFLLPGLAGCLTLSADGGGSKIRASRHSIGASSDESGEASAGRRQSVAHAMEGGSTDSPPADASADHEAADDAAGQSAGQNAGQGAGQGAGDESTGPDSSPDAANDAKATRKPLAKPKILEVVALRPLASRTPLPSATAVPTNLPTEPPTSTPEVFADVGPPIRVSIPAIGVDAEVEHVGLTPDRAMDVPKGWMNVGWYRNGFVPGELGNAVLAGHLDTSTGGPAVFWDLNRLVPGDEITVTYENGSQRRFLVEADQVYDYDTQGSIIDSIFGKSQTADLNLVTCDGAWDHGAATYSKRLVVFATLVQD